MTNASMSEWLSLVESRLSSQGFRFTRQRMCIARVLHDHGGHCNTDELYHLIRESDKTIGYATVYRALRLFTKLEIVETMRLVDGTARYEIAHGDCEHHDHLICVACNRVVEFENASIESEQQRVASDGEMTLVGHRMVLYGRCLPGHCLPSAS